MTAVSDKPHADSRTDVRRVVPQGLALPAAIPEPIFTEARRTYSNGQKLDMQALARSVGLGRATIYRHAGNREHLLDEVVWWRSRRALIAAVERASDLHGVARVLSVIADVLRAVEHDHALHAFLNHDPEAALRILTGSRSVVQQGMAATLESLLDLEIERGNFAADLDTPTLGYAIVRISEGFLYSDIIADRTPDIDKAIRVIEALLVGIDHTPPRAVTAALAGAERHRI